MRGALVHGVLLAVMLVYGYRTWTRDKTVRPDIGSVVLWDKSENDLVSIEYKQETKIVKLENKGDYWWGTETTIERKVKPKAPGAGSASEGSAAGSGSAGSAATGSGSAAGSGSAGSAAPPPPPVEWEETGRKTREFPVGEAGDKLVKSYAAARALRELGTPSDEQKKDYKLVDAKTNLTVTFKDGPHTFLVGGSVYGGTDKYAVDQQTGKAYILSRDLVSALEAGGSSLQLSDPRGFEDAKIDNVAVEAGGQTKVGVRVERNTDGKQVKTWGDADSKMPNQMLANFIDNVKNLKPTEYDSTLKPADLQQVMKLTYKDERGALLGTLTLYKHEKAGVVDKDADLDPANPPKGELEYLIMTEKTRVPGVVRKDTAQRAENDIEGVMSSKGSDAPATGSGSAAGSIPGKPIEPHGNPFGGPGKMPMPPKGPAPGMPGPAPAPGLAPAPAPAPAPGKAPAPAPAPAPAKAPAPGAVPAPAPAASGAAPPHAP